MTKIYLRRVAVLLLSAAFYTKAQEVSETQGLRLRATLTPKQILKIEWCRIANGSTILVNIGTILGGAVRVEVNASLKLFLSSSVFHDASVSFIPPETNGVFEGRADPWVIIMPARSCFDLEYPLQQIYLAKDKVSLTSLREKSWVLKARFTGREAQDRLPGGSPTPYRLSQNGPNIIPFWTGNLQSSVTYKK